MRGCRSNMWMKPRKGMHMHHQSMVKVCKGSCCDSSRYVLSHKYTHRTDDDEGFFPPLKPIYRSNFNRRMRPQPPQEPHLRSR